MSEEEKYRSAVCVVVTDGDGNVLLCRRIDENHGSALQTVQGGIDPGESVLDAAVRETQEELGVLEKDIRLLDVMEKKFAYRWADDYIAQSRETYGKKTAYVGQEQTFVLISVPHDVPMILDAHHQEFSEVFWGSPEELLEKSWEPKRPGLRAAFIQFGLLSEQS